MLDGRGLTGQEKGSHLFPLGDFNLDWVRRINKVECVYVQRWD